MRDRRGRAVSNQASDDFLRHARLVASASQRQLLTKAFAETRSSARQQGSPGSLATRNDRPHQDDRRVGGTTRVRTSLDEFCE
jgi:hypothetical protein